MRPCRNDRESLRDPKMDPLIRRRERRAPSALAALTLALTLACTAARAELHRRDVFFGGREGYHTYRIPALVVSTNGTLLAFCEGRKASSADSGRIDLLLKRSTDGGQTWSPQDLVWSDGTNTCG